MSKKTLLIVGALTLLGVIGVTGYFVLSGRSGSGNGGERSLSLSPKTSEGEEEVKADTLYEDTSGFSFKHPKEVKVQDVTPDGDEYYSQLNLSRGSEKIVITIIDTSSKTSDEWIKVDSKYSGASLVGAVALAGISAKQYSKGSDLITVAVDTGVLYLIVGPKDAGFWEDVQEALTSTFKFADSSTPSSASSGSAGIEYEEEEIIE